MVRVVLILLALVAVERAAEACCLGCACTKYRDQQEVLQERARSYAHSVKGSVPAWRKVTTFLTTGTWAPLPIVYKPTEAQPVPGARLIPPPVIRFVTADKADVPSKLPGQIVLIRRIEKHGTAILVEVDDRTFKLVACPKKPGYACLVDPGKLKLREIPPPGEPETKFAKPPR